MFCPALSGSAVRGQGLQRQLCMLACLLTGLIPATAWSQSGQLPVLRRQLEAAAAGGSAPLLRALTTDLKLHPELATDPATAATLARVAADAAAQRSAAAAQVYQGIADRIMAAVPPEQRPAVTRAVAAALRGYTDHPTPAGASYPALDAKAAEAASSGYRIGSFSVFPSLQAGGFYDDNIYATAHHHVADWVGSVSPRIAMQSNWDRNALYAAAQTDLTGYWSHPRENSIDWHALAEGRIDVNATTHILLGGVVAQEHEDRSSPDAVAGLEPTPYSEYNGYAGVVHQFGDFSLRVATAAEHLAFGNVMGQDGEINNQDRNRTRYTFGGTLRYEKNSTFMPFLEIMGDVRRYDSVPDDNGFMRDSDGFTSGLGSVFRCSPTLSGEVFLGVVRRSYRDTVFRPLTIPDIETLVRWNPRSGTRIVLGTERSIEETTLYDSPAYVYTLVHARWEQRLTARWYGLLRLSYVHRDFAQAGTVDNDVGSSAGLRYRLTPRVTLGIDYRYLQRVSGTAVTDFSRQQMFVRVATQF